jgi:hypothetical protein
MVAQGDARDAVFTGKPVQGAAAQT